MLRTRPLPVLVLVIGPCGVAAAKYHERASCRLFQARALARRWRSSGGRTTANASRLSRLRLHRLRTGCTPASPPPALCWSSSPARSDRREQILTAFTRARQARNQYYNSGIGLPVTSERTAQ
jgi:hypothetical protein